MKEYTTFKNYKLISKEYLEDVSSNAYTLEHINTGAKVVLIQNDDENKAFVIGFKTPQNDSTGVPHILEHSVLCGSEKYPVKDAMTEVSKGSLNTFLNAFTYPDRTLYPVASCNDKDFHNLLSVYLDAVFFPRVLSEKKIFMQEGWHYELENINDSLTVNGVVYNEMKGVYSSPESALSSYIMFSLFPDTQYGVESGGDPDCIPDLTYEDFCAFHKKLYHPSNSRIFLYGDMDFEEKLEYIHDEYLSKFEKAEIDSFVKIQDEFTERKKIYKEYPISDSDDEKDATFLSYNVVCSDYNDIKTTEIMNAINYALCSVPGAKLKQRLLDAGIGKDVYSELTTDTCQKFFSIIAQGANPEDEDKFVKIIEDTLFEISESGFDKKAIEASITSSEFSYREADFGYYPKGVAYASMTFEQWLYTDDNIFSSLKQNSMYEELRKGIETGLFESVLKERVLDNNHKTILVMKPKKGLSKEKDDELSKKLEDIKKSMSDSEVENILKETEELKRYHEEEDSEETLATIPTLSISDIKKEINKCEYSVLKIEDINEVYSEQNTNGIAYFSLCFDGKYIPERLIPALSILKTLLGYVDTKSYTFGDLINECNIKSGGINVSTSVYKDRTDTDKYDLNFEVRTKALYEYIPATFELIKEILFTSKLNDKKRVKENLEQSKVRIQSYMMQSGHAVAIGRAGSAYSDSAAMSELLSGMGQYRYIEDILADFDSRFDTLVKDMQEVLSILLKRVNLEVVIGASKEGKTIFDECLSSFIKCLSNESNETKEEHIKANVGNEAFSFASMVQYVAVCGNYFKTSGLKYRGSLQVLKTILNTDFLWNQVRVSGGAYGCFCFFGANGDSMMVSYRDPNLKKTIDVYNKAPEYVENFDGTDEDVERYVISTIGDFDTPLTPSMKTARAYSFYKSKITNEEKQLERDEILSTKPETIRSLSEYVKAVVKTNIYSCVGGEDILSKEGYMFDTISPLYRA